MPKPRPPKRCMHTSVICPRDLLTALQNHLRSRGSNVSEWFRQQAAKEVRGKQS